MSLFGVFVWLKDETLFFWSLDEVVDLLTEGKNWTSEQMWNVNVNMNVIVKMI